jgi:hypothetical protein
MPQEFRPEPLLIEPLEKLLEPALACAGSGAKGCVPVAAEKPEEFQQPGMSPREDRGNPAPAL